MYIGEQQILKVGGEDPRLLNKAVRSESREGFSPPYRRFLLAGDFPTFRAAGSSWPHQSIVYHVSGQFLRSC